MNSFTNLQSSAEWSKDRPHLQVLRDPDTEAKVAVTRDGRRNEAFAPLMPGMGLKQDLAICYSVVTRSGELVSGVSKKKHRASGDVFYCVEVTDEPERALDKRGFAQCVRQLIAA